VWPFLLFLFSQKARRFCFLRLSHRLFSVQTVPSALQEGGAFSCAFLFFFIFFSLEKYQDFFLDEANFRCFFAMFFFPVFFFLNLCILVSDSFSPPERATSSWKRTALGTGVLFLIRWVPFLGLSTFLKKICSASGGLSLSFSGQWFLCSQQKASVCPLSAERLPYVGLAGFFSVSPNLLFFLHVHVKSFPCASACLLSFLCGLFFRIRFCFDNEEKTWRLFFLLWAAPPGSSSSSRSSSMSPFSRAATIFISLRHLFCFTRLHKSRCSRTFTVFFSRFILLSQALGFGFFSPLTPSCSISEGPIFSD